jgi:hypothetical protein
MSELRHRRSLTGALGVLLTVLALFASSVSAWALYSSSTFSATANGTAGVLPTPTISGTGLLTTVTLTLGSTGGTLQPLSYTLSVSPLGGIGTGGTCQSTYTPASTLPSTCTYTGVLPGLFTYTLTAVYNSWSKSMSSGPLSP